MKPELILLDPSRCSCECVAGLELACIHLLAAGDISIIPLQYWDSSIRVEHSTTSRLKVELLLMSKRNSLIEEDP